MKKIILAFAVALLLAGAPGPVQAKPDWIFPESGLLGYSNFTLTEDFSENEFAAMAEVKDKLILVGGKIESVKNEIYYAQGADYEDAQGKFPSVALEPYRIEYGQFSAYLIDDVVDPAILQAGYLVDFLCEDVQKGPGSRGVQGKCRVVELSESADSTKIGAGFITRYTNQELVDLIGPWPE